MVILDEVMNLCQYLGTLGIGELVVQPAFFCCLLSKDNMMGDKLSEVFNYKEREKALR